MEKETKKKILQYMTAPQIMPRIRELFFSGFSHIAYFMAHIYRGAGLLPAGHPYLNPVNTGRFGVRHVIAQAGSNLVFKKENIDQIAIYGLTLAGLVILFAQLCMFGLSLFIQTAHAAMPTTFAGFFLVPDATHDLAFVMLDRVFGLPNMFVDVNKGTTCVVQGEPCFHLNQSTREITPDSKIYTELELKDGTINATAPTNLVFPWPFHEALHKLFSVYSFGLLLVAVFIFLYFAIAVVAETAQSGTPFGRRFNQVWAPLRMVAALGLLIPLGSGLNSAQYILMYAAKFGSGFATNGWILFNETATGGGGGNGAAGGGGLTVLGTTDTLVATPNAPPINTLMEFFTIAATCKVAYEKMYHERADRDPMKIEAYVVNPKKIGMEAKVFDENSFEELLEYFDNGDFHILIGEKEDEKNQTKDGAVTPYCGEVLLQITEVNEKGSPGAYNVLKSYHSLLWFLWRSAKNAQAGCSYTPSEEDGGAGWIFGCIGYNVARRYLPFDNDANAPLPDAAALEGLRSTWQTYLKNVINAAVMMQQDSPEWMESLKALGWGGAAVWYNKVAQLNGAMTGAVYSLPTIRKYPMIMEAVRMKKAGSNADISGLVRHQLYNSDDSPVELEDTKDWSIGRAMFLAQSLWQDHYSADSLSGNILVDVVNAVFGTSALFSMQANADKRIHPLAQLTAIGKGIMESAVRNLGFSAAAGLGGSIINFFSESVGGAILTISSMLMQIAIIGIAMGFVLFYVIPLLPFIYFFFAVGGWIKGLFEAMVGVPLWALAHIRIDGNGLPGDAALGGYYLILEVFLRPIMIIFGFLASITIFSAQVQILHEIWAIVVSNVAGYDVKTGELLDVNETGGMRYLRGAIDQLFFTAMYAIIVYMLGLSSFKMIDLLPNNILRWMGASISTFSEQSGDPAEDLVRNTFVGSQMTGGHIKESLSALGSGVKQGSGAVKELFTRAQ